MKESFEAPTVNAWTRARERYVEDLTDEEKRLFAKGSKATLEATLYDASAAEMSHRASSNGRKFTSRILLPLIDAIDQYSEALDVYANASSTVLCPLWGSVRVVMHVCLSFAVLLCCRADIPSMTSSLVNTATSLIRLLQCLVRLERYCPDVGTMKNYFLIIDDCIWL